MTPLEWGLVALIVVPLLQIPCLLYLSRYVDREDGDWGTDSSYGFARYPGLGPPATAVEDREGAVTPSPCGDAPDHVPCPHCGTCNDATYDVCRDCVGRLTAL